MKVNRKRILVGCMVSIAAMLVIGTVFSLYLYRAISTDFSKRMRHESLSVVKMSCESGLEEYAKHIDARRLQSVLDSNIKEFATHCENFRSRAEGEKFDPTIYKNHICRLNSNIGQATRGTEGPKSLRVKRIASNIYYLCNPPSPIFKSESPRPPLWIPVNLRKE